MKTRKLLLIGVSDPLAGEEMPRGLEPCLAKMDSARASPFSLAPRWLGLNVSEGTGFLSLMAGNSEREPCEQLIDALAAQHANGSKTQLRGQTAF